MAAGSRSKARPAKERASISSFRCRPKAALHLHARPLEIAVVVALAALIADPEQPVIAALRIAENLPAILVGVPEIEAVGAVLQHRRRNLVQLPLFRLGDDDAVSGVDLFLGFDVEAVMVEQAHFARPLGVDYGDAMLAAQADHQRDLAGLNHVEPEKFFVEFPRECQVARFERAMREEIEFERGLRFGLHSGVRHDLLLLRSLLRYSAARAAACCARRGITSSARRRIESRSQASLAPLQSTPVIKRLPNGPTVSRKAAKRSSTV